jgi:hypothetical protein
MKLAIGLIWFFASTPFVILGFLASVPVIGVAIGWKAYDKFTDWLAREE